MPCTCFTLWNIFWMSCLWIIKKMLACVLSCLIVSDAHSVNQLMHIKSLPCAKHCSRPGNREGGKKRKGACSHRTDILVGGDWHLLIAVALQLSRIFQCLWQSIAILAGSWSRASGTSYAQVHKMIHHRPVPPKRESRPVDVAVDGGLYQREWIQRSRKQSSEMS